MQARAGQRIRVALYWHALEAPGAERTVSVRLLDAAGGTVAQQDNWPGQGTKPTSWWEEGWEVRDLYYLDIPPSTPAGTASLRVLVYDSYSLEIIPFDDGTEMLHIAPVEVVP